MLKWRKYGFFWKKRDSGEDERASEMDLYSASARDQIDHNRLYHRLRVALAGCLLPFVGFWDWKAYGVFDSWRKGPWECMGYAADFCGPVSSGVIIAVITVTGFLTLGLFAVVARLLSPVLYLRREDFPPQRQTGERFYGQDLGKAGDGAGGEDLGQGGV